MQHAVSLSTQQAALGRIGARPFHAWLKQAAHKSIMPTQSARDIIFAPFVRKFVFATNESVQSILGFLADIGTDRWDPHTVGALGERGKRRDEHRRGERGNVRGERGNVWGGGVAVQACTCGDELLVAA